MILQNNSNLIIKIILIILLQNLKFGTTEFYSSINEMTKLVEMEHIFVRNMENFIKKNEDKLNFLKEQLTEFEQGHEKVLANGSEYFDSEVNQYLLTKRLTVDWERIQNLMEYKTGEKALNNLETRKNEGAISYEDEFNGGIAGLLRIQEVYRLKSKDISSGILQGKKYKIQFNIRHCFDIGIHAIKMKKYRLAYSWLIEAFRRLFDYDRELDIEGQLELSDILAALAETKIKLGDIKGANETYTELLELRPDCPLLAKTYQTFNLEYENKKTKKINYKDEHEPLSAINWKDPNHDLFKLTCSEHNKKSPSENRDLRCGYLTETHPFLILAPIKTEELNHDPLLVQYYDVLSNDEIKTMRKFIKNRIKRATVMGLNGSIISQGRTSQFLFVPKTELKLLETIDQRVQDMTNLDMIYSEDHQFQNYGIGGHYAEHHDYFQEKVMNKKHVSSFELGNRIATVLFYLSKVKQGGATAFPFLRQLVKPQKGSAVFWYNLHASGDRDVRTMHGGCPVIVGSKWVLNRWVRERYQDQARPCEFFNDVTSKVI